MARALEAAQAGACREEVPVGAVVVLRGRLLSEGNNRTIRDRDPTAHAEVVALRRGAARLGDWRLSEATLYTTLEPCTLCCGAAILARVDRVVYGASDPKAGMAGSLGNLLQDRRLNHQCRVTSGVLGDVGGELLRTFFRERR